ncbi:hypothetical protein KA001_03585, partial [Patescibacteria group bacterium]|nr:hypothetical protein [Patescibacteria group bacterium]
KLPKNDTPDAVSTNSERLFASLHGLLSSIESGNSKIVFNIVGSKEGVKFYCLCKKDTKSSVQAQLYAHFSQIQISDVPDFNSLFDTNYKYDLRTLNFSKKQFFPIKTFKDFDYDPLNQTIEVLSKAGEEGICSISYTLSPINDGWQDDGYDYISILKGDVPESFYVKLLKSILAGFGNFLFPPSTPATKTVSTAKKELNSIEQDHIANIESKLSKMGFKVSCKVLLGSKSEEKTDLIFSSVLASYKQYSDVAYNQFEYSPTILQGENALQLFLSNALLENNLVLNTEELAGLIHFSGQGVATPFVERSLSKKAEPPLNLPILGDVNFFGTTNFREKQVKFGIRTDNVDRLRHMYFVGKTGVGKSTLFENMIIQDIIAGRGCGYIDPHGDTIDKILRRIPKERINDVVLIDISDSESPVGINVLELVHKEQKNLLASSVLTAFKLQFGYSWGPRLEYLLNYALLTLVEIDGTTLLSVTRLLTDKNYRKFILEKVTDPVVLRFWNFEYPQIEQTFASEAISPIQNKVNRFLSSTTLRNVVGQRNSTIDFNDIMDNKKILLVKLSKGLIGDDNAYLLGSFIVNRINFFAMQRAKIREEDRVPFYLFVDEFQNFASESFVSILSEARKYALSLHLTHQYTAQLPLTIKDAILGNVGSIVAFTLGSQDAKELGFEFAPVFDENDLITQEVYNFYVKLQIDGSQSKPFSGKSLAPIYSSDDYTKEIIETSRKKYGRNRDYVENKVKIWIERPFDVGMAIAQRFRDEK